MTSKTMVFADPKMPYAYSVAEMGKDGIYRSNITSETLEDVQVKYPAAQMIDIDDFVDMTEKAATTDPVEITEERYWHLLEVLPPGGWVRNQGSESFWMIEFTTGRVTNHIVRIGERYFSFEAPVMKSHADRVKKVSDWLETQSTDAEGEEANEEAAPLNCADDIERRMRREEIVEILEGRYSVACYDHESTRLLAETLAEAANTEGDSL